jgi:transcriptional regulator with XRE-family HTH domain
MSSVSYDLSENYYSKSAIMSDMDDMESAEKFSKWLVEAHESRGWSQAELARRAGVSRTSISDAISCKNPAGFELCAGIAHALKLPPEIVFRAAGLLPPDRELDEIEQELSHLYRLLPEEKQQQLLEYARFLLAQAESEEKRKKK